MSKPFVRESRPIGFVCCVVMLGMILTIGTAGCGGFDDRRLENCIEDVESQLDHPGYRNILMQLKRATPQTLSSPVMCDARARRMKDKVLLLVYWIEDFPTPDAVQLIWNKEPTTTDLALDKVTRDANLSEAETSVIFNAAFYFSTDETVVQRILQGEKPSVVMLRDGKPVSNSVQLEETPEIQGLRDGTSKWE